MRKTVFAALVLFSLAGVALAQTTPQERLLHGRAVEAAIWGMPAVNADLMLQEMLTKTSGKVNQVIYWGRPLDWRNQTLTPNPDVIYLMVFFNTKDVGPVVLEIPPGDANASLTGNIDTVWQTALEDVGLHGVDKGAGGKFVIVPPGYKESIPAGYTALRPDTYSSYALLRSNMKSHSDADVAASIAYGKRVKVYPLSAAASPPETVFTDVKDVNYDSTIRYDASYFVNLDRIVQSEPWIDRDRAMIDQLRSIGIEKGKPFAPDAATQQILTAAIGDAKALLEQRYDKGFPPFYPNSNWMFPTLQEAIDGQGTTYANPDHYAIDARALLYTYGYISIKRPGTAQFYLVSIRDRDGRGFEGGQTYRLRVPANAPVDQYWSVTAYDRQTHALIKSMPRASRASNATDLQKNADGSVDIYFGPKAPTGKDSNWVPTDPQRLRADAPCLRTQKGILRKGVGAAGCRKVLGVTGGHAMTKLGVQFAKCSAAISIIWVCGLCAPLQAQTVSPSEARAIAKEATIYGFPLVDTYRIQHSYFVDRSGPEFKAVWNTLVNNARVYTPDDKAIQTPNSDTPYSYVGADLRAEPLVFTVPEVEKRRYYSLQFIDMYTFNFAYVGSRATGNSAGNYLLAGPKWNGEKPKGIRAVIPSETEFAFVLYRTQLFNPGDIDNVKKIQAGYKVQTLSAYLGKPAPASPPAVDFPTPLSAEQERSSHQFFNVLNFLLQFCPTVSAEKVLMTRFAKIGVGAGKPFDANALSPEMRKALQDGMADAWATFNEYKETQLDTGKKSSADAFGTRQALKNNYLNRMSGAALGIYGNSKQEAMYPAYFIDAARQKLDGASRYTLRFAPQQLPPVNAFWSLTMYELPASLLYANPLNRYLINSSMLPSLKRDADGGITLYIQNESPGTDKESNWLPAPKGPFFAAMRLYWPKPEALDGKWKAPLLQRTN